MSRTIDGVTAWPLRTAPKDVGVAAVVLVALALGLLLRYGVEGRMKTVSSAEPKVDISYPANWRVSRPISGTLMRVENPQTASTYKTNVTVESRELDPASPPTLQELVDRRVAQHGSLEGYHFLSNSERTVNGNRAANLEYAFVVQPIDTPRSASLPVVVHSREYIVVTKDRTYYLTLAAPENDFARVASQFDGMVETARLP
ncbi:MAG: hypothetical protein ACJ78Q_13980 [Chloroflexia bacterium]